MTTASKITIARILLVPVFGVLAMAYACSVAASAENPALRHAALAAFVLAASTDGIDGWVARRFHQTSAFGAFIDPIADKALMITGVLILSFVDWGEPGWRLPLWFGILAFSRDALILIGIGALYVSRRGVRIEPHWSGKFCTVTQLFALGWVMLRFTPVGPVWPCLVAGVFTVWSGAAYLGQALRVLSSPPAAPSS